MTDYTELIKNLKYLSDTARYPFVKKLHAGILMKEAADAIEQLVKERDSSVEDLKLSALRGISVCRLCKNIKLCDDVNFPCKWEWRGADETD